MNGYVTGAGIDCGAGRTDCDEAYPVNTSVALEAVPSPGYVFLGWAGFDCVGAETVVVLINRLKSCTPVFSAAPGQSEPESPDYSQGALFLDGSFRVENVIPPGGRARIAYVAPNSIVSVTSANPSEVRLLIDGSRSAHSEPVNDIETPRVT